MVHFGVITMVHIDYYGSAGWAFCKKFQEVCRHQLPLHPTQINNHDTAGSYVRLIDLYHSTLDV